MKAVALFRQTTPLVALILLAAATLAVPTAASAQDSSDALLALLRCTNIRADDERLQCFDTAASSALRPPERSNVSGPVPQVRIPGPGSSSGGARIDSAPVGERQVTIVEARTNVPGRAVFITAEGETFVQTSGRSRLTLPSVPFQAQLRPGAVGSTFLTPEGSRSGIRVTRRN